MKRILFLILLSFAISAPAANAAKSRPSTQAKSQIKTKPVSADSRHKRRSGLYVGAQLGDSIVGGLLGITISNIYSLEVRYDYADPVYQPNNTVNSSSIGISGIAMFPLKVSDLEPLFMFAKAGYERSKVESTTNDPGIPGFFPPTTTIITSTRKRVMIGAGFEHDFSKKFSGRIGVNFVGSDHSTYLTAIYKF